MRTIRDDTDMHTAFAVARTIEPTEAEVSAILARVRRLTQQPSRTLPHWRRRYAAPAFAAFVLLAGGVVVVPATRAAVIDVVDTFAAWAGGHSSTAPGRPLSAGENAAAYLRDPRHSIDPRVIAEADGYKLVVAREPDGAIEFDLGDTGVGIGGLNVSDFNGYALYVLGPGSVQNADEHGHVPLFGITARTVKSVELVYASGPPLRVAGIDGGFVLLADPKRDGREVVAFDAHGNEVERASLHNSGGDRGIDIHWEDYGPPAPRIPSRCLPGAVGLDPPPGCPNS